MDLLAAYAGHGDEDEIGDENGADRTSPHSSHSSSSSSADVEMRENEPTATSNDHAKKQKRS